MDFAWTKDKKRIREIVREWSKDTNEDYTTNQRTVNKGS